MKRKEKTVGGPKLLIVAHYDKRSESSGIFYYLIPAGGQITCEWCTFSYAKDRKQSDHV